MTNKKLSINSSQQIFDLFQKALMIAQKEGFSLEEIKVENNCTINLSLSKLYSSKNPKFNTDFERKYHTINNHASFPSPYISGNPVKVYG